MAQADNKQQNKRISARERIQEAQRREQTAARRRQRIVVTVSAVAVLALAGGVAVAINSAGKDDQKSSAEAAPSTALVVPANASGQDGTVITYGKADAPHTMEVYEDFRCPVCKEFEAANGQTVRKLTEDGQIKVQFHLAAFLDKALGGKGSHTALAAAGAALNEGVDKFKAFHDVLYANQPDERNDGFGDVNRVLELADQVPGLKTDAFVKAVTDRTYAPWAAKVADAFNDSGVTGTPTIKVDGKSITLFSGRSAVTPEQFTAQVKQAAGL
ncbi:thioredoxin domain-containing protein [Streptomyces kaniharaensis]|uniref:Thioredoxin domain-containing protein n=1 Tax=Streptomyces kaniharaensis TaxID=212423 RepID=A0A6N7KIH1_9ACTN|nr:thioredoxin domain-containing protein [Streptomyces kaniharaensis]MQS11141.1 thioredoxin domain-containing protein [Streptomyces kaniharaensis]